MTKVQSQTMYKRKENSTCLSLLFFLHSNKQVLYVSFSDMSCDMVQTSQMVHSSLEIKTIQVDNQLPSAVYPVALFCGAATATPPSSQSRAVTCGVRQVEDGRFDDR